MLTFSSPVFKKGLSLSWIGEVKGFQEQAWRSICCEILVYFLKQSKNMQKVEQQYYQELPSFFSKVTLVAPISSTLGLAQERLR